MKRFSLFLFLLCALLPLTAATSGTWTFYQAYHEANSCAPVGNKVYACFSGNLLCYDTETAEVTLISKNDGFNGQSIAYIAYSQTAHCLIVSYEDLSFDLLYDDGDIVNLSQVKNSSDGSLALYDLSIDGGEAICSMSDGVVEIDLTAGEIKGYYKFGLAVYSAAAYNGYIYVSTSTGLLVGAKADNLSDPTRWMSFSGNGGQHLIPFEGGLYLIAQKGSGMGLWWITPPAAGNISDTSLPTISRFHQDYFTNGFVQGEQATFYGNGQVVRFNSSAPTTVVSRASLPTSVEVLMPTSTSSSTYWAACGLSGLRSLQGSEDSFVFTDIAIGGYGPRRDYCYNLGYYNDYNRLLIAGGRLDPYDLEHYEGTITKLENNEWSFFQEEGIATLTGVAYRDITRVVQDPADSAHHFASSGGTGLYEFRSGQLTSYYNIENSPLVSAAPTSNSRRNYVRVDGVNYDSEGNLWMVNNSADSAICILKTDGTWSRIFNSNICKAPTLEKTFFDSKGRFWVASRRTVTGEVSHTAGLLCLDYNGTIDDTSDDVATYRSSGYNQDGTSCSLSGGVYEIMQDTDGSIWIGAASGLYVVQDPDEWSDTDLRLTQIKVPRNDGTNYADYLLADIPVTAIDIDGADRKWIGTNDNGLYLVSADGTEILQHFVAASSPLPSDQIYDIAVNQRTGEVMIATDAGLCSYQSDATAPATSLDKNAVSVYPNPVHPEQNSVTVTGLTADADVKITTMGGQAVASGRSNGGTFTWNCCSFSGHRVASGIYYIMVATASGDKGIVAKVVII